MNFPRQPAGDIRGAEMVLSNATVVTRDEAFIGTVVVRDGIISAIDRGTSRAAAAQDLGGDYLLPGLVELHTDNLERHVLPRPGVFWPPDSAILAHDAEVAGAGITTVLDALRLGSLREPGSEYTRRIGEVADAVSATSKNGHARAEHFFHMRCEISCDDVAEALEPFLGHESVRLVSVMDHTPGQRQFVNIEKYKEYFAGKYGMNDEAFDAFMQTALEAQARNSERHRRSIVSDCRERGIALASHDDATLAHVEEAVADGVAIAEFPTTEQAAAAATQAGLHVLAGAPNVVRGGSHSGNIAVVDLAAKGVLDTLSSDYIPASLLRAAFRLHRDVAQMDLPQAVATVSRNPAHAVGLTDRGEIAPGKRADLLWVHDAGGLPVLRSVWRQGNRVA